MYFLNINDFCTKAKKTEDKMAYLQKFELARQFIIFVFLKFTFPLLPPDKVMNLVLSIEVIAEMIIY